MYIFFSQSMAYIKNVFQQLWIFFTVSSFGLQMNTVFTFCARFGGFDIIDSTIIGMTAYVLFTFALNAKVTFEDKVQGDLTWNLFKKYVKAGFIALFFRLIAVFLLSFYFTNHGWHDYLNLYLSGWIAHAIMYFQAKKNVFILKPNKVPPHAIIEGEPTETKNEEQSKND